MKSILVHIDASPRSAERLNAAKQLAERHGAELSVQYAVLASILASPWVAEAGVGDVATIMAELDRRQLDRARALFDRLAGARQARWIEPDIDAPLRGLVHRALTHDLVVLGQYDEEDAAPGAVPPDLVSAVLIDSGVPALVVPRSGSFDPWPTSVLLAWKPTREAARAARAALPWLAAASVVHLASRPEGGQAEPFAEVEHWLRIAGVRAPIERHVPEGSDVGASLLALARSTGAGLLAMGCYGHSRAREWVFGGATRGVLQGMTLPVLMAH